MRKLVVFNSVTLDGYFTDAGGDMSWAHRKPDAEWEAFVSGNAKGEGTLVFGRITYEMMAGFWPTPMAERMYPSVARGMNRSQKVVFSKTLKTVSWENTKLVKGDLVAGMRKLKKLPGKGLTILGSGSLVVPLAEAGLIDEFQFVVVPVALGQGRTLFDGLREKLDLKLKESRTFRNGNVWLSYSPAK